MSRLSARARLIACVVFALASATSPAVAQNGGNGSDAPTAREIVDRHVEAIGGREALMKLHSRRVWARFEIPGERIRGTIEVFAARPNKRVLRVTQDNGTDVTGFDGRTAWRKEPNRAAVAIRGVDLAQVQDDALYDLDLHDDADFRLLQNTGRVKWEGRDCHRIRVASRSGREWVEFYDVATGLFAGSESRRETGKGQLTYRTVVLNYRSVDGVRLPHELRLRSGGVEQIIRVISVSHNSVRDAVFVPPSGVAK